MGGLREPRRHDDAAQLRHRLRRYASAGGLCGDVPVLRHAPRPPARAVLRVRAETQGRAGVRKVPAGGRLRPEPQGVEMNNLVSVAGWTTAAIALLWAVPSPGTAQGAVTVAPIPARPDDVATIDGMIQAFYEVISGPAGQPRE